VDRMVLKEGRSERLQLSNAGIRTKLRMCVGKTSTGGLPCLEFKAVGTLPGLGTWVKTAKKKEKNTNRLRVQDFRLKKGII